MLPQAHRLTRRVLAIVVEIDDVRATGVPPACQDRVVFAEVSGMLDDRDGNAGRAHELPAHRERVVPATVVHQDDFMSAVDLELLDIAYQRANGRCRVVHGHDEGDGRVHQEAVWRIPDCGAFEPEPPDAPMLAQNGGETIGRLATDKHG